MRTMEWPPVVRDGRISFVENADAAAVAIIATLGDLSANPFNPADLGMGEKAFATTKAIRTRAASALRRISSIVHVDSIEVSEPGDGSMSISVRFQDLESRERSDVRIRG